MMDDIVTKFQNAGLWVRSRYDQFNQDCVVFIVSDRSKLKDKQTFYLSVAFSGLEMIYGESVINYKINKAIADYSKVMENYGGFERVDAGLPTKSPRSQPKWIRSEGSSLLLPSQ